MICHMTIGRACDTAHMLQGDVSLALEDCDAALELDDAMPVVRAVRGAFHSLEPVYVYNAALLWSRCWTNA
eukprot:1243333-Amphidinium_carterae.1